MKRILLVFIFTAALSTAKAQNIQLHYDMGDGRGYFTSTVEMFKPDSWGSTFFFIDMDYNVGAVKGVSLAYWEIARAAKFWEGPIAMHFEYNGGFGRWQTGEETGSYPINDCWLTGVEYSWNAKDFSKGFTLQTLYKYIHGKHNVSFQLTGVWYLNFAGDKLSFTGYADFWREDFDFGMPENPDKTKYVFQSEPQIWYNINSNVALGSESEVDYNFLLKGWHIYPTIGAKVTF